MQGTSAVAHNLNDNVGLLFTKGNADEMVPQGSNSQGAIYYIGSDGLPHLLAPGTPGNFLQTAGAGANPTWATGIAAQFGGGSDVNVTLDGTNTYAFLTKSGNTYKMQRDTYFANLTINTGITLDQDGWIRYVSGTESGVGTIISSGGAGHFKGTAGVAGATSSGQNGTNGTNLSNSAGNAGATNAGGQGGSSGSGSPRGQGGAGGTVSVNSKIGVLAFTTLNGLDLPGIFYTSGSPGGGGGAGAADLVNSVNGGSGGASGTSLGLILGSVNNASSTITYLGIGGAGVAGSATAASWNPGGGQGGAGGTGATVITVYVTKTGTYTYTITGGAGGAGGAGHGTGSSGSTGATGTSGTSYEVAMNTLTR